MESSNIDKTPANEAATMVRQTDAKKRYMDIDVKWTANNRTTWPKNLGKTDAL